VNKLIKYVLYFTLLIVATSALYVFSVLYEEMKVKDTVTEIFATRGYEDISLVVCLEEKCLYDFGKENEHVNIYTVGRGNIEARIELARKVAQAWPTKNHLCKTYTQGRCQL